mmetsp:Transcript_90757/g.265653  ORF Transcript_90757/g.265653 Transcript_90757/m.265653 type:complete len:365 (-) Transcript_90757:810-1904(-)
MGTPQGVDLDGLIQELAIHVALRAVHIHGRDTGVAHRLHNALLLSGPMRRGQAGNLAVGVHHGARDRANKLVLVVLDDLPIDDLRGTLEAHSCTAISADVAVGRSVEALAAALIGVPALHAMVCPPHGRQQNMDTHSHGKVVGDGQALLLHGFGRNVCGREPGGRFCGQCDGGTLHAQAEGETPGVHAELAGDASEALPACVEGPLIGPAANVDASCRVHQLLLLQAHGCQCVVTLFHQNPLVRIQPPGLVWRQVEELVIKKLSAFHEDHVLGVCLAALPAFRVGVVNVIMVPSHNWHLGGIVRPVGPCIEEVVDVIRASVVNANASNAAHLTLVKSLVHGLAPAIWDLRVPGGHAEVFHGFQI